MYRLRSLSLVNSDSQSSVVLVPLCLGILIPHWIISDWWEPSTLWKHAKRHVLPFEHETLKSRNMNFHIRAILTLWLGFTWSGILAVRSATLHTWSARVVSCHGIGPKPYTWQVSTLSPLADNANTGKRCVATGQLCIHSRNSIWIKHSLVKLIIKIIVLDNDSLLFWQLCQFFILSHKPVHALKFLPVYAVLIFNPAPCHENTLHDITNN